MMGSLITLEKIMYYYEENNKASFDILFKDDEGNIKFIAEVINIDDIRDIVDFLNRREMR